MFLNLRTSGKLRCIQQDSSKNSTQHRAIKLRVFIQSFLVSFRKNWPRTSICEELCTCSTQTSHAAKLPQKLWHYPVYELSVYHTWSYSQAHSTVLLVVIWSSGKPAIIHLESSPDTVILRQFSIFFISSHASMNKEHIRIKKDICSPF